MKKRLYNMKNEETMQPRYKELCLNKGTLGTVLGQWNKNLNELGNFLGKYRKTEFKRS